MSDPSETSGRPLASIQQPEGNLQSTALLRKRRKTSQSSDERIGGTKSTPRRRPVSRNEESIGPHPGSSRHDSSTMQRSTSPTQMSPDTAVHYTRTGRISKAKKGLKVHNCDCGRSYTRAEHLRRHQKNHAQDALVCEIPECGKTFYRVDLLQRHQERHNEIGKESRRPSFINQGPSAEPESHIPTSVVALQSPLVTAAEVQPYYPQVISAVPESTTTDARYTSNPFRTPQVPSSALGHVLRSSPTPKFNANSGKHMSTYTRTPRQPIATAFPVQVDGLTTNIPWADPFSQSPNYSSSSGYASPVPEYANVFTNPPYGSGQNRTRASSNGSFIDQPWGYPSRSPTSATSTMAYTWTSSNDKNSIQSNLAYMATSYPMTSVPMSAGVDPMPGYGHFNPKSMLQRDEEEQAFLFPEQSYGMGQITHTYPYDQYLDNYWRLFHPSFPVVHRSTFTRINGPPMLHAAMIAVGGQYSNDATVKRKSRLLHDRCMKLLDKRELDVMTEPDRLCDYQALFLIEVLSQYRARRAAKTLSSRFGGLYQKLCQESRTVASALSDIISALAQPETATYDQWTRWIELTGRNHLLLCCYMLEYQQAILLARTPEQSVVQLSGVDLPFPAHSTMWDAEDISLWAHAARQCTQMPSYLFDITQDMASGTFDTFQSCLLIAAHYNHFSNSTSYLGSSIPAIEHLLENSAIVKHQLLTAKILQATPIRALLAISGESWILSEKVPSPQAFQGLKVSLKTWVSGLWAPTESHGQPVKDALKLAIDLLQHTMMTPAQTLRLELGADMGLYFAALIVWAVTVAANARNNAPQAQPQPHRYQSHSPLPATRSLGQYPSTPTQLSVSSAGTSPVLSHPATYGLLPNAHSSPAPAPTSNSMLHSDMIIGIIEFLGNALVELEFLGIPQWPQDVAQWQRGCASLIRWVKMRLRSATIEGQDNIPIITITGGGGDGHGELLDGVISVLDKITNRGWDGWF